MAIAQTVSFRHCLVELRVTHSNHGTINTESFLSLIDHSDERELTQASTEWL